MMISFPRLSAAPILYKVPRLLVLLLLVCSSCGLFTVRPEDSAATAKAKRIAQDVTDCTLDEGRAAMPELLGALGRSGDAWKQPVSSAATRAGLCAIFALATRLSQASDSGGRLPAVRIEALARPCAWNEWEGRKPLAGETTCTRVESRAAWHLMRLQAEGLITLGPSGEG